MTGSAWRLPSRSLPRRASTRVTPPTPSSTSSASSTASPTTSSVLQRGLRRPARCGPSASRRRRARRPSLAPRASCDRGIRRLVPGEAHRCARGQQRQRLREPETRHPLRRRLAIVPGRSGRGGRRRHRRRVPFLTRPLRRFGQLLILLMAIGGCTWAPLPDGAFAAVVLGGASAPPSTWASARPVDVRRARRSPPRSRSSACTARDVELAPDQTMGETLMLAQDDDGPLHVRVLGRDEADAQYMAKVWRFLLYKDGGPRLYMTRLEDIEHEAYTLLLAARAAPCPRGRRHRHRGTRRGAPRRSTADRHAPRRCRCGRRDRRGARRGLATDRPHACGKRDARRVERQAHPAHGRDRHGRRLLRLVDGRPPSTEPRTSPSSS